MAYEVTATRRRPQLFEQLIGQEFVVATLKNAITTSQIAHAYLFTGPRGCGKTTSARLMARALNCEKGPTATPCGECAACREIARGASFDVIEIDGASNTSVNDVRQIKDEILFPPNSYRYKVYIIDEVHMLSTPAFNALLKTIEEPPPYVIFIFATTELQKVPATIKSRCQQFTFRLGSIDQIKNMLAAAASEVGIKADDEALFWIARESTGSFRDAYTLFDQVAAFSEGHITYEKIRDKLGLVGLERLNELCEDCVEGNTGSALEKIDLILQSGVSIEQLISNFADYLRSLLFIRSGIKREALLGQSVNRFSTKVLNAWNNIQLERALSMFLQLFRDVRYSLSPRFELELAVSRLCWLSKYVSTVEVKQVVEQTKQFLLANNSVLKNRPNNGPMGQNSLSANNQNSPQNNFRQSSAMPPPPPLPMQKMQATELQRPTMSQFSAMKNASDVSSYGSQGGGNPFQYSDYCLNEAENNQKTSSVVAFENLNQMPNVTLNQNITDMAVLKDLVVAELQHQNNKLLASAISQSKDWQRDNNQIKIFVENVFQKTQIEREVLLLLQIVRSKTQSDVVIKVEVQKQQVSDIAQSYPELIQEICEELNGSVINCRDVLDKTEKTSLGYSKKEDPQNNDSDTELNDTTSDEVYIEEDSEEDESL